MYHVRLHMEQTVTVSVLQILGKDPFPQNPSHALRKFVIPRYNLAVPKRHMIWWSTSILDVV